jgi:hypothetical protein
MTREDGTPGAVIPAGERRRELEELEGKILEMLAADQRGRLPLDAEARSRAIATLHQIYRELKSLEVS